MQQSTMNTNSKERPRVRAHSSDDSSGAAATAGLFVHRSGSKPLPLSGNRFVLPDIFKKKANVTTSSATILRRTGADASFSDQGKELSGDEDNVSDAWICAHCSSKNHTRSKAICTICKEVRKEAPAIAQPRRGRRQQRDVISDQEGSESQPVMPRRTSAASRSWSPPHHQQQTVNLYQGHLPNPAQNSPTSQSSGASEPPPPPAIVPVNPFDELAQVNTTQPPSPVQVVSPSPSYTTIPENVVTPDVSRGVTRTVSVDRADSAENSYVVTPHQPAVASPVSPHSRGSEAQRSSSPAFSTTTSVDTPVHSNRAFQQDPFAPYPHRQPRNVLRPVESASDMESSTTQSQFREEDGNNTIGSADLQARPLHLNAPQPQGVSDDDDDEEPRQRSNRSSSTSGSFRRGQESPGLIVEQQDAFERYQPPPCLPSLGMVPSSPSRSSIELETPPQSPGSAMHYNIPKAPPLSPGAVSSSAMETMPDDGQQKQGDEETGQIRELLEQNSKSHEQCIHIAILVSGLVLLLVAGFLAIYFVIAGGFGGEDSSDSSREIDWVVTLAPTAMPTPSSTTATPPLTQPTLEPSLIVMTETNAPTFAPTTESSSMTTPVDSPTSTNVTPPDPWTLKYAQLGQGSSARLGEATALCADGTRLAASQADGSVQFFNITQGRLFPTRLGNVNPVLNGTLLTFDVSSNCASLAAGMSSGAVVVYSFDGVSDQWIVQDTLQITQAPVERMSLSMANDGDLLAVGVIGLNASAPVQLWALNSTSTIWHMAEEFARDGTFNGLHVDLAGDGTMLAIGRRQFAGTTLEFGLVTMSAVDRADGSFVLSHAGSISVGRSSARVSLSANGMRMVVSNVPEFAGGWSMYLFNILDSQWALLPAADEASQAQGRAASATISDDGTSVAVLDDEGKVFLREQRVVGGSLSWVTADVTENPPSVESVRVSLSQDGQTIAVGRPWYSLDANNKEVGLVQIYRNI